MWDEFSTRQLKAAGWGLVALGAAAVGLATGATVWWAWVGENWVEVLWLPTAWLLAVRFLAGPLFATADQLLDEVTDRELAAGYEEDKRRAAASWTKTENKE